MRAKTGAGGRLSLKVNSVEEAKRWIELNVLQGRAKPSDFIVQEYLPGRDLAFDSLWHDSKVTEVGIAAVKALSPMPHGFYSVDIKEDADGKPKVTEVDGKWHTTAPLWGYAVNELRKEISSGGFLKA